MIEIDIPGRGVYRFEHLVLDLNGTISLDGAVIEGVPDRIDLLRRLVDIVIVTADTQGKARELGQDLRVKIHILQPGEEQEQKLRLVRQLGRDATVSVGNGANDASMLKESILGICVIGPEGASSEAIACCDLVTVDINAALDLLLKPHRLIATLRR
ncbi:MAG: Potassium-transporting ATPase B chain [Syntrophus sp. PtaB.Bin075]|nr:MAG: Potassium-transporting ATPase B chain [Syntrophus sp. PtaB.Bin075]